MFIVITLHSEIQEMKFDGDRELFTSFFWSASDVDEGLLLLAQFSENA